MLFNDYIEGFEHNQNYLSIERQRELINACRRVIRSEPLWRPLFVGRNFKQEFALENTNCGKYGWLGSDSGFIYSEKSPTGKTWQPIPEEILSVVRELTPENFQAENCLINFYQDTPERKSHLGLHLDKTEKNQTAPIVSISLGQSCIFQIGGLTREAHIKEVILKSGDVVVLGGGRNGARNAYHGVKCLLPNTTPTLLGMKSEARVNITVRQVY